MRIRRIKKLLEIINSRNNFILATHLDHDPDALSSLISTAYLLNRLKKIFFIYFEEKINDQFAWLPYQEKFVSKIKNNFENVIIVDCENYKRTGSKFSSLIENKFKIIIDHHQTNKLDGDVNFVWEDYSATSLILFKILKSLKLITPEIASVLLLGIMGDTNYLSIDFKKNNDLLVTKAIYELVKNGADLNLINRSLNFVSWKSLVKEKEILSNLKKEGDIVYVVINKKFLNNKSENKKAISRVINRLNKITDVKVGIAFKDYQSYVKLSFRSQNDVDVGYLAKNYFQGGGHKQASGGKLEMKLKKAIPYVLKIVKKYLKK